jgi:site-specific DNA recombinase
VTDAQPPARRPTACAYVRVSTDDQAEHKISIASQIAAIAGWCEREGVDLVETFIEPGMSGRDEGRPMFARMMDAATSPEHPYDMVVVYILSRFARDVAIQA